MPRSFPLAALTVACSGLIACGGESAPEDAGRPDGGAVTGADGSAGPTVEIGTGLDRFEPIAEGDTLPLEVGPQGGGRYEGYHIYSAVRVQGYSPTNLLATFRILDADGNVQAEQARSFRRLQPDGDAFVAFAVAPRLMDCCEVEGEPVILAVEVEDEDGLTGADERRVMAGELCEDPESPGTSLCP